MNVLGKISLRKRKTATTTPVPIIEELKTITKVRGNKTKLKTTLTSSQSQSEMLPSVPSTMSCAEPYRDKTRVYRIASSRRLQPSI